MARTKVSEPNLSPKVESIVGTIVEHVVLFEAKLVVEQHAHCVVRTAVIGTDGPATKLVGVEA